MRENRRGDNDRREEGRTRKKISEEKHGKGKQKKMKDKVR
jgi:hypothetical protein